MKAAALANTPASASQQAPQLSPRAASPAVCRSPRTTSKVELVHAFRENGGPTHHYSPSRPPNPGISWTLSPSYHPTTVIPSLNVVIVTPISSYPAPTGYLPSTKQAIPWTEPKKIHVRPPKPPFRGRPAKPNPRQTQQPHMATNHPQIPIIQ